MKVLALVIALVFWGGVATPDWSREIPALQQALSAKQTSRLMTSECTDGQLSKNAKVLKALAAYEQDGDYVQVVRHLPYFNWAQAELPQRRQYVIMAATAYGFLRNDSDLERVLAEMPAGMTDFTVELQKKYVDLLVRLLLRKHGSRAKEIEIGLREIIAQKKMNPILVQLGLLGCISLGFPEKDYLTVLNAPSFPAPYKNDIFYSYIQVLFLRARYPEIIEATSSFQPEKIKNDLLLQKVYLTRLIALAKQNDPAVLTEGVRFATFAYEDLSLQALLLLGNFLEEQKRYDRAKNCFELVLQYAPKDGVLFQAAQRALAKMPGSK